MHRLLFAFFLFLVSLQARAAFFASGVVSFAPGTGNAIWGDASAALGSPDGLTGENPAASLYDPFYPPSVLSPFSGAFQGDEIVQVGEGGQLTLQLSRFAIVGTGKRIGVFTNAALIDTDYPNGANGAAAAVFGGGNAIVSVSADNLNWTSLGEITFDAPNLFYSNAGPFDLAAPASPQLTDFGLPFPGSLASFNAADWPATRDVFKVGSVYSGGGTWLDLSATGLTQVGYVQFFIPDDGNATTNRTLAIDALSIANTAVGAEVPEPGALSLLALASLYLARRRRQ